MHVGDLGMATASDAALLAHATADRRLIVTLDADFHRLLALSGAREPSVLRVREEGLTAESLVRLLVDVLDRAGQVLEAGALASVSAGSVRIRALPITRTKPKP